MCERTSSIYLLPQFNGKLELSIGNLKKMTEESIYSHTQALHQKPVELQHTFWVIKTYSLKGSAHQLKSYTFERKLRSVNGFHLRIVVHFAPSAECH